MQAQRRALQYERKLEERRVRPRKARRGRSRRAKKSKSPSEAITSEYYSCDKMANLNFKKCFILTEDFSILFHVDLMVCSGYTV